MYDSDTGEHISNDKNELEYIPFPVCKETGKPLELQYGIEDGMDTPCMLLKYNLLILYRAQLHDPIDNRSLLPPPRILHSQRRPSLLPDTLATTGTYPPWWHTSLPTSRRIPTRVRTSDICPRRHSTIITSPRIYPSQHPSTLDTKTPPSPP